MARRERRAQGIQIINHRRALALDTWHGRDEPLVRLESFRVRVHIPIRHTTTLAVRRRDRDPCLAPSILYAEPD
jgi:hypothetical protein